MLIDTSSERSMDDVPAARMLRSLVLDAFELAMEVFGPERFESILYPYYRHATQAVLLNLEQAKLIGPEDPLRRLRAFEFSGHMSGGMAFEEVSRHGDGVLIKIKRCSAIDNEGRSAATMKAYCEFNRRTAQKYWFSEMEPEMQLVCLSSRAEGSDRCVELIVPKAGREAEVKEGPEPLPLIQFDDSLLSYYPAAYLIETWALMMFIIAGEIGEDEASERMKEKIAQRSRDYHHEIEGAPEGIVSRTFADLLISFQPGRSDKGTLLEIHSCPLSAASPFCCGLFLDLLNGILSDEQGRKLEHLSMVTKGDKACRMLLTESLAKKTKTDREEPVKILRLRLARGEISEAEYLRLRELIGE